MYIKDVVLRTCKPVLPLMLYCGISEFFKVVIL